MWLTAEIPPLWHSGYIYTRGGGVALAWGYRQKGRQFVPVDTKTGLLKLLILLVKHLNWCIRKVKNYFSAAPNTLHHLV